MADQIEELAKRIATGIFNCEYDDSVAIARALIASESENAALRAQIAALTEWAAKVEHADGCPQGKACCCICWRCQNQQCGMCIWLDHDPCQRKSSRCSCRLSTLPADLIARGRELLSNRDRLGWLLERQSRILGWTVELIDAELKRERLKGESK